MGTTFRNRLLVIALSFLIQSCSDVPTYAPVYDIGNLEPIITKINKQGNSNQAQLPVGSWTYPVTQNYPHEIVKANKGIDFLGQPGEPIFAAAKGKVVYCGSGLRGYGNLIIIKHDNKFLSVYAHNDSVLVHQGDYVKSGQTIAKMGSSGTKQVKLHFEIRRLGKPVNPLILVQTKPV